MRKKYLEKRMARLKTKVSELAKQALASTDADEIRSLNARMAELNDDIDDIQDELDLIDAEAEGNDDNEQRGAEPTPAVPEGAQLVNPVGSFSMRSGNAGNAQDNDLEYRQAFMAYVQHGTQIPANLLETRADAQTVTADIGAVIPKTVMDEFIKEVSKVYGQLYGKVRKLSVQGGVEFPISELSATFHWITEAQPSGRQKAGDIKNTVSFSYHMGEIKIAHSLLSSIVSLPVFENELVRVLVEAYVKAMDEGILLGTGSGQMLGLLNDTRVTSQTGHTIALTAKEISDWTAWRKKFFSKLPLGKRSGEFIFPASTVESYLLTMADSNNNPIFKEASQLQIPEGDGQTDGRFFGRAVTQVEPELIADYDTAQSGDVIGVYWTPQDYAINTQYNFGIRRYYDEDKNQWVTKGLTVVDGKVLDPAGVYLITKA